MTEFIDGLQDAPIIYDADPVGVLDSLQAPPGEDPAEFTYLLDIYARAVRSGVESSGPRMMAHVPGGGIVSAALAEFLAAATNRYTARSAHAPAAVALEHGLMRWLCGLLQLPDTAVGVTTSGTSMAALSAIVAARSHHLGQDFRHGTVYLTDATHRSIRKAAMIAGLDPAHVRVVPSTPALRMDIQAARTLIEADRAAGLSPFLIVGTAGSTDTGTVDPLRDISDLAHEQGLWFHVDAAYGGFFHLTAHGRKIMAGIHEADSISLDPHKSLFLPSGIGILLVRDYDILRNAYAIGDNPCLAGEGIDEIPALPDYAELGPELTRSFRGLPLWLPLHLHGVAAFRGTLEEKLDLARMMYQELRSDPRLDLPWPPDLSIVAFRLTDGDDADHQDFLQRVQATGRVSLSSARIDGRIALRLCVLSHRVHREHIHDALAAIRENL
ncbi:pyridoxal phosphate-dependent decarboxylase family protein [Nocardia sp. NPDC058480]|uniref:pyridoxal phosphate-dependent decarboxylase family protein n=1 Tax=unclassified Nocardia TaxID=2637762 RepID=UPI0036668A23